MDGLVTVLTLIPVASSSAENQAPALSCLHLFRSLGSEFGLAICGAVLQGVLQVSIRHKVGVRDGITMDKDVLDEIADQVRKSLTVLDDLDPRTAKAVRESYGIAVLWCFVVCAMFFAGALVSAAFAKGKRIGDERDEGVEAAASANQRSDNEND